MFKSLILLLVWVCAFPFFRVQAQENDSLWNSFKIAIDKIAQKEKGKAYTIDYYSGDIFDTDRIVRMLLNTTINERISQEFLYRNRKIDLLPDVSNLIVEQAVEYMYQNYGKDSLPNVRDLIGGIFYDIARLSNDESIRKKVINHSFDIYIEPQLYGLWLKDFDDSLKQRFLKHFSRKFTDEELSFFAASHVKYQMTYYKSSYDYIIAKSIKEHQSIISYEEAKEKVYQSEVAQYKETILTSKPPLRYLIIASQLNMTEAIPYLEEYANSTEQKNKLQEYAIYALARMGIGDYRQKAIQYFEIDEYKRDAEIASVLNNQDIWYAYVQRLQSKKYDHFCPIAYRTIKDLADVLEGFPERYPLDEIATDPDKIIIREPKPFLVPYDYDSSTRSEKIPIDEEAIRVVINWMEGNKGKYKLQHEIDKTF